MIKLDIINEVCEKMGSGFTKSKAEIAVETVFDSMKKTEIEYKLVTSEEADVTKGLISTSSPIGKALMGKKVGEKAFVVTPTGKRTMEIRKLITMHEAG